MDKTDIFGEFGLWVWGKSIPTDVDKCQIFMRQSPLGEYIKMFQAENKKLKEQQLKLDCENNLTEDEILFIITPKGLPPLPKHIRLAKKIIAKMKEKAE